jgi:hypothetical protein
MPPAGDIDQDALDDLMQTAESLEGGPARAASHSCGV